MANDPVTAVLDIGSKLIDKFFTSDTDKANARLQLLDMAQKGELAVISEQSANIRAEATSESWLARSWRPIVMLTFTGLIVARWFGWAAPNLQEQEYIALWDIVKLGLGGYVIGRSVEKVIPAATEAIVQAKKSNKP